MVTARNRRAIVLVIDALGVGALPDAPAYGDSLTCNTMGQIDATVDKLALPTLESYGLGNILPLRHVKALEKPLGLYGKLAELSPGKDTTTGHWEMMGTVLPQPFPTYPDGFPQALLDAFCQQAGVDGVLANKPASGTKIIEEYGSKHLETGWPILYTSADSVWQLAAHIDKIPLETLYHWCVVSRELLQGEHEVSRVIARPFEGEPGAFRRLGVARKDYAVPPPEDTVLTRILKAGGRTVGVGKIDDIFCGAGISHNVKTKSNADGLDKSLALIKRELALASFAKEKNTATHEAEAPELLFINLVETDMNYGHRRDVEGYAQALEVIDQHLAAWLPAMREEDMLIISGDHGCDPTAPGSDHTREYAPFLMVGPAIEGGSVGVRASFADIGQTVLAWLNLNGSGLPGAAVLASKPERKHSLSF